MTHTENIGPTCGYSCCTAMSPDSPSMPGGGRARLIRDAFRLEWLAIGWMVVEAVVALASGIAAGSLVLVAFGLGAIGRSDGPGRRTR